QNVRLKEPREWTMLGKPTRRIDAADKVQGKPGFGIDVRLPGMLYASLVQCPVFKGRLESVDESKLAGMRGIRKVVKLSNAGAVVADTWWQANKALSALGIVWDDGGNGQTSSATIAEFV